MDNLESRLSGTSYGQKAENDVIKAVGLGVGDKISVNTPDAFKPLEIGHLKYGK